MCDGPASENSERRNRITTMFTQQDLKWGMEKNGVLSILEKRLWHLFQLKCSTWKVSRLAPLLSRLLTLLQSMGRQPPCLFWPGLLCQCFQLSALQLPQCLCPLTFLQTDLANHIACIKPVVYSVPVPGQSFNVISKHQLGLTSFTQSCLLPTLFISLSPSCIALYASP